ncbi:metallophosphoesterase family protein [Phytoactinopolyspora halotolerans]|uniref:DNA repair exonuclease n=1 Tax=Phytoactinopolyspora halotolerans TaxID=1981512 RepID=A0A6L9S481_9ACTN|nr:DNA repair exonuclease [Phytoactinopolyspora halotolerans]NED99858.1 DNA repair exonuclease [Phytoactinopolyspora halotolerans]
MTTVVHAADVHLNSPLRRLAQHYPDEDWHRPTRDALARLVAVTIDETADVLILAGDIADRDWYDDGVARLVLEASAALYDAGVTVVAIDGNHDAACGIRRDLTAYGRRLPPNVVWFDADAGQTAVLDDAGLAVHGRSLPASVVPDDLTSSFPARVPGLFNIGVQHTSLDHRRGSKPCAPTTVDALLRLEYDYWALGHVHARRIVSDAPSWIAFAGNTQGRKPKEEGAKGATVFTVEGGQVRDMRHRLTATVRWARLQVNLRGDDDSDTAVERVHAELDAAATELPPGQRLAARVELTGQRPHRTERQRAEVEAGVRRWSSESGYLIEQIRWPDRAG